MKSLPFDYENLGAALEQVGDPEVDGEASKVPADFTEADFTGDWSWHPDRSDESTYRPKLHPRACPTCRLTSCLGLINQYAPGVCA